ncbi:MAG: hypothetical protein RLZ49_887 [Actinomycetota bacterium]|jgi:hypothetical protein
MDFPPLRIQIPNNARFGQLQRVRTFAPMRPKSSPIP